MSDAAYQPLVLHSSGAAIVRLEVPDNMVPVAIDGNMAVFEAADSDVQRHYQLPIGDRSPCTLRNATFRPDNREPFDVQFIEPNPEGEYVANLMLEGGGGAWWVLVYPERP